MGLVASPRRLRRYLPHPGLRAPHSFFNDPGVGLGGLVRRPDRAVLGGLPFASSDFRDFCAHGPRMRNDDLSALPGRFFARVPAAVTTVDRRPGRGAILPAADTAFD